jgi:hypothetical protein
MHISYSIYVLLVKPCKQHIQITADASHERHFSYASFIFIESFFPSCVTRYKTGKINIFLNKDKLTYALDQLSSCYEIDEIIKVNTSLSYTGVMRDIVGQSFFFHRGPLPLSFTFPKRTHSSITKRTHSICP